jgi:hypothetical protein
MTKTDIANMALRRLQAQTVDDLSDDTRNARAINAVYAHCVREVMRVVAWPCLTKRTLLTAAADAAWTASTEYTLNEYCVNDSDKLYVCITAGTSAGSCGPTGTNDDITDGTVHWKYVETVPENLTGKSYQYIIPYTCIRIIELMNDASYVREGWFMYSNTEDAKIRFIYYEKDPDRWDDLLQTAVILRIAWAAALEVTGKKEKSDEMRGEFMTIVSTAEGVAKHEATEQRPPSAWWGSSVGKVE